MDGSSLDAAYSLVKKADHAVLHNDYAKARAAYLDASARFLEAMALTLSEEAKRTLQCMADLYNDKAKQLTDAKVVNQLQKMSNARAGRADDLTSSLASARGIQSKRALSPGTTSSFLNAAKPRENQDPFYAFYSLINQAFARAHISALEKAASTGDANSFSGIDMVTDSFYLVANHDSNSTREELLAEIASLRQVINKTNAQVHAYEVAVRAQKDIMRTALNQLKTELNNKMAAKQKEHEIEVEQLRADNDKLKIQIGRLKSRWDDLKQQARKKRDSDSG